jgi:hypothetical protein
VLAAGCGVGAALAAPANPMADKLSAPAIAPVLIIFFSVMTITSPVCGYRTDSRRRTSETLDSLAMN